MPITHAQMNELAVTVYKEVAELLEDFILPVDNPDHMGVFRVAQKLIKANVCEEMNHLKWEVNVVVADDQFNAFVLPVSINYIRTTGTNVFYEY